MPKISRRIYYVGRYSPTLAPDQSRSSSCLVRHPPCLVDVGASYERIIRVNQPVVCPPILSVKTELELKMSSLGYRNDLGPGPGPGLGPEPRLPFEIIRRIIHCRLALDPSFPRQLRADEPTHPGWDSLAGQCGRQATLRRRKERIEIQTASLDLMRVCKAWKVSLHPQQGGWGSKGILLNIED